MKCLFGSHVLKVLIFTSVVWSLIELAWDHVAARSWAYVPIRFDYSFASLTVEYYSRCSAFPI